jgi:hypothetical protein
LDAAVGGGESALAADEAGVILIPATTDESPALTLRHIARIWWPLTLSWIIMAIEGPMVFAMAARLADPEINLAALGGIVRAVTFAIESPLLMLLTASAALSKDWESYCRLRRYTWIGIGIFTVIYMIVALTPVYDWVTRDLIGAPGEIVEPARIGMIINLPYLAFVAYRRLNHGVLIRFGYSSAIAQGTIVRFLTVSAILVAGVVIANVSGVVVGALTMLGGVLIEAAFIEWKVRPVLRGDLRRAPLVNGPINSLIFLKFYVPLALTSVAMFLIQPIISAALSRLPDPILSLAVWPTVAGVAGLIGAGGTSMVELVVTLLEQPGALPKLRQFSLIVSSIAGVMSLALAATPLGTFWFGEVSALNEPLLTAARQAYWLGLLFPVAYSLQGLYRGILTHGRQTQRVSEAVFLYTLTVLAALGIGVVWGQAIGLYVATVAMTLGMGAETIWMWWRSRKLAQVLQKKGQHEPELGNARNPAA